MRNLDIKREGLAWRVSINKKLICDGFETRRQALEFIENEIKPTVEGKRNLESIDRMIENNLMICDLNDSGEHSFIRIGIGTPDKGLPDFQGL